MTEITPETLVAATPPTVELVADLLTEADNDLHDGYDWKLHLGAASNVVAIGVEPFADDGTLLPEVHYRAVVVEGEQLPLVLDRAQYRARVEEIVKTFSTTLATSAREIYPYHLARLKGALWALAEPGETGTEIARVTAQDYHATRDDVTGGVELRIGGPEGTVVIDLGEDGDEILAGLLTLDDDVIVLERPAELGLTDGDGEDLLVLTAGGIRLYATDASWSDLDPDEAREMAAQLAAMADAAEAAFPQLAGGHQAGSEADR